MKKYVFTVFIITLLLGTLVSCNNKTPTGTETIYAAGYYNNPDTNKNVAFYAQGNASTCTPLTDGTHIAEAFDIAVDGSTVYCAGIEWQTNFIESTTAFLWQNTTPYRLSDAGFGSEARAVAFNQNNVYCAGWYDSAEGASNDPRACYWTFNGTDDTSTDLYSDDTSRIYDMILKSGALFMTGNYSNGAESLDCYWVDDTSHDISQTEPFNPTSIAVANSVYIGGFSIDNFGTKAGFVMDDGDSIVKILADSTDDARAEDITIKDGRVYLAGYHCPDGNSERACYWTYDGVDWQRVTISTEQSEANAIVIAKSGTIYVGGYYRLPGKVPSVACYWKIRGNSIECISVSPPDAYDSEVNALFLVE